MRAPEQGRVLNHTVSRLDALGVEVHADGLLRVSVASWSGNLNPPSLVDLLADTA